MVLLPNRPCFCKQCLNINLAGRPYLPDYIEIDLDIPAASYERTEKVKSVTYEPSYATREDFVNGVTSICIKNEFDETVQYTTEISGFSGRVRLNLESNLTGRYSSASVPKLSAVVSYSYSGSVVAANLAISYTDNAVSITKSSVGNIYNRNNCWYEGFGVNTSRLGPTTKKFDGFGIFFGYRCQAITSGNSEVSSDHGASTVVQNLPQTAPQEPFFSTQPPNTIICKSANNQCRNDAYLQAPLNNALPVTVTGSWGFYGSKPFSETVETFSEYGFLLSRVVDSREIVSNTYKTFSPCPTATPAAPNLDPIGFRAEMTIKEIDVFRGGRRRMSLSQKPIQTGWGDFVYCNDLVTYV